MVAFLHVRRAEGLIEMALNHLFEDVCIGIGLRSPQSSSPGVRSRFALSRHAYCLVRKLHTPTQGSRPSPHHVCRGRLLSASCCGPWGSGTMTHADTPVVALCESHTSLPFWPRSLASSISTYGAAAG